MKKRIGIAMLAMGMCLGLATRLATVSAAQPQDEKMQSEEKMSGEKMEGKEKMSKKKMKKQKKAKRDKMDKMGDKRKIEEPKN
jgi:hypothetical protein